MVELALLLPLVLLIGGVLVVVRMVDQLRIDKVRKTYALSFPADVDAALVTEFIRSISGILRPKPNKILSLLRMEALDTVTTPIQSIVIETWGLPDGIKWYLKVPYGYEEPVRQRLESLISGIQLSPEPQPLVRVWVHAEEIRLRGGHRTLNIRDQVYSSVGVRSPFGHVKDGEVLAMQWLITPMIPQHKPIYGEANSKENSLFGILTGKTSATHDEVNDRRDKLDEPNVLTALRVAAVAPTKNHARSMVRNITSAFDATRGPATYFVPRVLSDAKVGERFNGAVTPSMPPVQLTAPELATFTGWPLGSLSMPGQPTPISRRVPPPSNVGMDGIQLGVGNYAGQERKIALGFNEALVHQFVLGPSGGGKTVYLANIAKQMMEAGKGVIVIQMAGNLADMVLDYVPPKREEDVIVFNASDTRFPIGMNILKDGDPRLAVSRIEAIFKALYRDHPSLWSNQAMYHGLHTLAASPNATVIDLLALLKPTGDELDWAYELRSRVRDPQLKRYWQALENETRREVEAKMEPIHNRFWPIMSSSLVNILGQGKSSFTMEEVVRQNKILTVDLSGLDETGAELMGSIIVTKLWQAVVANPMPHSPNYLILDEGQHFMKIPVNLSDMLVEARKHGLGLTFANQHLHQLTPEMKSALLQNAQTKVVFQTGGEDAREMARVFGSPVTDYDVAHLPRFGTWTQIATPTGTSHPFTMATLKPAAGYGNAQRIIYASRGRYGREVNGVMDEILARRSSENVPKRTRGRPSVEGWGDLG